MSFISGHPGIVYMAFLLINTAATVIIAGALVSIAISLRKKKENR